MEPVFLTKASSWALPRVTLSRPAALPAGARSSVTWSLAARATAPWVAVMLPLFLTTGAIKATVPPLAVVMRPWLLTVAFAKAGFWLKLVPPKL